MGQCTSCQSHKSSSLSSSPGVEFPTTSLKSLSSSQIFHNFHKAQNEIEFSKCLLRNDESKLKGTKKLSQDPKKKSNLSLLAFNLAQSQEISIDSQTQDQINSLGTCPLPKGIRKINPHRKNKSIFFMRHKPKVTFENNLQLISKSIIPLNCLENSPDTKLRRVELKVQPNLKLIIPVLANNSKSFSSHGIDKFESNILHSNMGNNVSTTATSNSKFTVLSTIPEKKRHSTTTVLKSKSSTFISNRASVSVKSSVSATEGLEINKSSVSSESQSQNLEEIRFERQKLREKFFSESGCNSSVKEKKEEMNNNNRFGFNLKEKGGLKSNKISISQINIGAVSTTVPKLYSVSNANSNYIETESTEAKVSSDYIKDQSSRLFKTSPNSENNGAKNLIDNKSETSFNINVDFLNSNIPETSQPSMQCKTKSVNLSERFGFISNKNIPTQSLGVKKPEPTCPFYMLNSPILSSAISSTAGVIQKKEIFEKKFSFPYKNDNKILKNQPLAPPTFRIIPNKQFETKASKIDLLREDNLKISPTFSPNKGQVTRNLTLVRNNSDNQNDKTASINSSLKNLISVETGSDSDSANSCKKIVSKKSSQGINLEESEILKFANSTTILENSKMVELAKETELDCLKPFALPVILKNDLRKVTEDEEMSSRRSARSISRDRESNVISDSEFLIDDEISDQPELTFTFKDPVTYSRSLSEESKDGHGQSYIRNQKINIGAPKVSNLINITSPVEGKNPDEKEDVPLAKDSLPLVLPSSGISTRKKNTQKSNLTKISSFKTSTPLPDRAKSNSKYSFKPPSSILSHERGRTGSIKKENIFKNEISNKVDRGKPTNFIYDSLSLSPISTTSNSNLRVTPPAPIAKSERVISSENKSTAIIPAQKKIPRKIASQSSISSISKFIPPPPKQLSKLTSKSQRSSSSSASSLNSTNLKPEENAKGDEKGQMASNEVDVEELLYSLNEMREELLNLREVLIMKEESERDKDAKIANLELQLSAFMMIGSENLTNSLDDSLVKTVLDSQTFESDGNRWFGEFSFGDFNMEETNAGFVYGTINDISYERSKKSMNDIVFTFMYATI